MSRSVSFVAVLLVLLAAQAASAGSPLFQNLGSDAFETIDNHSEPGKWLIVMIWASDCEICKHEAGSYQQFHDRHREVDARVLGITLDGSARKDDALAFVDQHKLKFDNLIGEPEVVMGYFQLLTGSRWVGTPTFLVFGPDGELMAKQAGAVPTDLIEQFIAANTATQ